MLVILFLHIAFPVLSSAQSDVEACAVEEELIAGSCSTSDTLAVAEEADAAPAPYLFSSKRTLVVAPQERYEAGSFKAGIFGDEYRDVWTTPLEVPVIDLDGTAC